ncbi:hypothetical protein U9M48_008327 [Paspalum notatum var. saurae]|uniref:GRF-type domain-containing protein n=1 Tax=Paspalum notatum var. saurae TaxID=547442 RepID=A0AAQ3SP59_PASNO
MAGKSLCSSSSAAGGRRRRPDLPLITCTDCSQHTVLELEVKTNENGNRGRIFYKCPSHKRDGSGCPFWHWEEGYVNILKDLKAGKKQPAEAQGRRDSLVDYMAGKQVKEEKNKHEMGPDNDMGHQIISLIGIAREIVVLLKC